MVASISTLFNLLRRDMRVFRPGVPGSLFNCSVWGALNIIIFKYIFPQLGVRDTYVLFMVAGALVSWGLFDILTNVSRFVADLTTVKSIEYDLTLPLPHWMVFLRFSLTYALQSMMIGFCILPVSKLILWNELILFNIAWVRFVLAFVMANMFYGFFTFFVASLMKDMHSLRNVWVRAVYPLWLLGGYQFSWTKMNAISPIVGKIALLNPMVYVFESIRGAMFGQEGFINFWYCIVVLLFFCVFFGYIGTKRMMKRLDCI